MRFHGSKLLLFVKLIFCDKNLQQEICYYEKYKELDNSVTLQETKLYVINI